MEMEILAKPLNKLKIEKWVGTVEVGQNTLEGLVLVKWNVIKKSKPCNEIASHFVILRPNNRSIFPLCNIVVTLVIL